MTTISTKFDALNSYVAREYPGDDFSQREKQLMRLAYAAGQEYAESRFADMIATIARELKLYQAWVKADREKAEKENSAAKKDDENANKQVQGETENVIS